MTLRLVLAALAAPALGACALPFFRGPLPGEPTDAAYLEVGGARVRFLEMGQGPAVVLLHGFASSIEAWAGVIPALAREHRVLALDLKGFGWSDRPPGDYSPEAQAALVRALLEARGIDRAAVVAHSWGASVALALALEAPERVTRLVLYDAFVYEDQLPTFFLWARAPAVGEALFRLYYGERAEDRIALAFHDPSQITEELVRRVERALELPGTLAAALATVRGMRFAATERRYATVKKPVLLLWGREDTTSPVSIGERLARDLPSARLVVYPLCGHLPMIEARAASTADLLAFLREAGR